MGGGRKRISCNSRARVDSLEWQVFNPAIDSSGNNIVKRKERREERGERRESLLPGLYGSRAERKGASFAFNKHHRPVDLQPAARKSTLLTDDEVKWKRSLYIHCRNSIRRRYVVTCMCVGVHARSPFGPEVERESAQFLRNWPSLDVKTGKNQIIPFAWFIRLIDLRGEHPRKRIRDGNSYGTGET